MNEHVNIERDVLLTKTEQKPVAWMNESGSKARDLLESCLDEFQYYEVPCYELVIKIKELLAQPEQEPVAWKIVDKSTREFMFSRVKPTTRTYKYEDVTPLYASPPKREPLSDETIAKLWGQ
jgi:hypothetical protein